MDEQVKKDERAHAYARIRMALDKIGSLTELGSGWERDDEIGRWRGTLNRALDDLVAFAE